MKHYCRAAFSAILFFFSLSVNATCEGLKINKGFDIVFRIENSSQHESVIATGNNSRIKILWSNNPNESAVINDVWTVTGGSYDIWLHFIPGKNNNFPGELQYYMYRPDINPDGWSRVTSVPAVLSGMSNNISVTENNVTNLSCNGALDPPEPPKIDVCELFPTPVQSWSQGSSITFNNPPVLPNTASHYFISGWNTAYKEKYLDSTVNPAQLKVGFDSITDYSSGALTCHDGVCIPSGPKINTPPKISHDWQNGLPDVTLDAASDTPDLSGSCKAQLIGDKCDGDKIFIVNEDLNSLTVAGDELTVAFQNDQDRYIKSFTINDGKVDVVLADNSQHWFETFTIHSSSASISAGKKSTINITQALNINNPTSINNGGNPDDLVIYAPDATTSFNFSKDNVVKALLLAKEVNFTNGVHFIGAVTTNNLTVNSSSTLIEGRSECFTSQPKNLLKITPKTAFGLTCERMPVTFSVRKENGDLDTNYSGTLNASVTSANSTNSCWALTEDAAECNEGDITTSLPGGQRKLWLQSKTAGEITIEGATGDLSDNAGPYRFAPFGFRINGGDPAKMVAGKTETLLIEAVADTGAKCEVIEDYGKVEGEVKKLKITSLDFVRPTTGSKSLNIDGSTLADGASKTKRIQFKQGKALLPVTYNDAGEITFELLDKKWKPKDCEANSTDCDDHEKDWKGLKGKAVIYSRPYTFALCGIQSAGGKTDFSGTSSSGNGFAAAGETFSVTFKPIIWRPGLENPDFDNSGDSNNDIVTTGSEWCQVATTANYYSVDDLISAPLNLTHLLDTPDGGDQGVLQGTGTHSFKTQQDGMQGLTISNLSWSEVGSLWLQASATYLGMTLDQGVGTLGRFYPHHFTLKNSTLVDADPYKFTYMDQAFKTSFEVEAQNLVGGATLNYGDFAIGYQEALGLVAIDGGVTDTKKNELTPRLDNALLPSGWGQSWSKAVLKLENASVGFKREVTPPPLSISPPPSKITTPDGPYDVRVGLVTNIPSDCATRGCTDFADQDLEVRDTDHVTPEKAIALAGNITARYGRLKLDDANSQFDKVVNIPVRAQYWDSSVSAFVLNTDDSTSKFNGSNYCKQVVWATKPDQSNSILVGDGQVSNGKNLSLTADPKTSEYYREQVRFWLRLTSNTPADINKGLCVGSYSNQPWFQFNWRGLGDESPSAVVTFGVYRGNDRIIYRGEKGMNQLLN